MEPTDDIGWPMMHVQVACSACGRTAGSLEPGWAMRADFNIVACPDHVQYMPPHPKGWPVREAPEWDAR